MPPGIFTIRAQAPQQPPKPRPELQRLAYFAGKWTSTGEMKPGPMGPGGKMTGTSNCEWFAGGYFLVCRGEGTSPGGPMQNVGVLGYNGERKRYTYYGYDNMGNGDPAYGQIAGDTWNWEGESLMGGQTVKQRYTIKQLTADSYRWKWEMSVAGGEWALVGEGMDTRVK
ncbi:MAG: DUF1579 family protein [Gemmatimonadales bacterium]